MNLRQTTTIYFVSRVLAALFGFLSTIYFARVLGAEALGVYSLVLAVVSWLSISGDMGIIGAVRKRISEGDEKVAYVLTAAMLSWILFLVSSIGVVLFRDAINEFVGYPATTLILAILFSKIAYKFMSALLEGQQLVHLSGVFTTLATGLRSVLQIGLLFFGFGVGGLLSGYAASYVVVAALGILFVARTFQTVTRPNTDHLWSVIDYAKFSWIGGLRGRALNWLDITVLGFFVSSSLVGIYSVAWMLSNFLFLFAASISKTLFPEMSTTSSNPDCEVVSGFLQSALSYGGLLLLPGLIGGAILGDNLLRLYSSEFTRGSTVLVVLLLANLIHAYQSQFLNTLNALDRPDLTFKINSLFIILNLILNVLLVYYYGWIGAAVATTTAVGLTLVVAYSLLSRLLEFSIPTGEIGRQVIASSVMGVCLSCIVWLQSVYPFISNGPIFTLSAIGFGAVIYFSTLGVISRRFRRILVSNFPWLIPL